MILLHARTKCEVDAIKECIDLLHNGYFILFSSGCYGRFYVKLKHCKNGRILSVTIKEHYYEISEKGKILKRQDYTDELISD